MGKKESVLRKSETDTSEAGHPIDRSDSEDPECKRSGANEASPARNGLLTRVKGPERAWSVTGREKTEPDRVSPKTGALESTFARPCGIEVLSDFTRSGAGSAVSEREIDLAKGGGSEWVRSRTSKLLSDWSRPETGTAGPIC